MKVFQCALQDMAPYVPLLMPELKAALIDPLPEVRATSAKALGSLLKGMGQQYFEDVLPWLLETLKSEGSSVERSGAAQGLAEVLAVLGPAHVEALLPDILAGTKSKSPFVREGHLTLFKFLPLAIPQTFQVNMPCMFHLGQHVSLPVSQCWCPLDLTPMSSHLLTGQQHTSSRPCCCMLPSLAALKK